MEESGVKVEKRHVPGEGEVLPRTGEVIDYSLLPDLPNPGCKRVRGNNWKHLYIDENRKFRAYASLLAGKPANKDEVDDRSFNRRLGSKVVKIKGKQRVVPPLMLVSREEAEGFGWREDSAITPEDILWVYNHIVVEARRADCPSSGAWGMLAHAREDTRWFYDKMLVRIIPEDQKSETGLEGEDTATQGELRTFLVEWASRNPTVSVAE